MELAPGPTQVGCARALRSAALSSAQLSSAPLAGVLAVLGKLGGGGPSELLLQQGELLLDGGLGLDLAQLVGLEGLAARHQLLELDDLPDLLLDVTDLLLDLLGAPRAARLGLRAERSLPRAEGRGSAPRLLRLGQVGQARAARAPRGGGGAARLAHVPRHVLGS